MGTGRQGRGTEGNSSMVEACTSTGRLARLQLISLRLLLLLLCPTPQLHLPFEGILLCSCCGLLLHLVYKLLALHKTKLKLVQAHARKLHVAGYPLLVCLPLGVGPLVRASAWRHGGGGGGGGGSCPKSLG